MARKEIIIDIKDRDNNVKFKLHEMSALKVERWKYRAILLLLNSNIELPEGLGVEDAMAYLTKNGIDQLIKAIGSINSDKAIALFDEMLFNCTSIDIAGRFENLTEELVDLQVEDSNTLTKLRFELLKLHFGFLENVGKSFTQNGQPTDQVIKI